MWILDMDWTLDSIFLYDEQAAEHRICLHGGINMLQQAVNNTMYIHGIVYLYIQAQLEVQADEDWQSRPHEGSNITISFE